MALRPVLHRVFVLPDKVEDSDEKIIAAKKAGLIVELDKREQKANVTGTVISIGTTAFKHDFGSNATEQGVSVGSKVLFGKYAGGVVPNSDWIVLNDEDILGVYTDE